MPTRPGADPKFEASVLGRIRKHDKDLPDHMLVAADALDGLKDILDTGRVPDYYEQGGDDVATFLADAARTFASVARRLGVAFDTSN